MKKIALLTGIMSLATLCGCVVAPSPYYGNPAPYYGTAYAPAYADIAIGGYYPSHGYQHIYSGYNANYWHHQRGYAGHPGFQGAAHGGGHNGHR